MNIRHPSKIELTLLTLGFNIKAALLILPFLVMQVACDTGKNDAAVYNDLVLKFYADHSVVRLGEPVHMRFTIKNSGVESAVLESKDTPVMDIAVTPYGSDEIFLTWSAQNSDRVAHRLEWQPGESKTIELTWTSKQGEIWYGAPRDVGLSGFLYRDSKTVQDALIIVCASNVCQ